MIWNYDIVLSNGGKILIWREKNFEQRMSTTWLHSPKSVFQSAGIGRDLARERGRSRELGLEHADADF